MRLLHVIHSLNPNTGGPAEAVRNFVTYSRGTEQHVVTLNRETDSWMRDFPGNVHCVAPGKGNYGYSRKLNYWLRDYVAGYEALIIHGLWQFHGFASSRAATNQNVPYFVFPHGMLDPYFDRISFLKKIKKRLYWPIEKTVLERARAVLFTCAEEGQRAIRRWELTAPYRLVPLGVKAPDDGQQQAFFDRFPDLKGKRLFLFLGRLHPKKGPDLLIRAFAKVARSDLHLLLVGPACSETYEMELRALASQLCPPDSVTFAGMLSGEAKFGAMQASEIFVLPSHQENFGLAVAEALACGLPVLVSDQVNIWREIQDDGAGFIAPDTEAGVLGLLRKWLAFPAESREAMRSAALRCYKSRFRAETASERFINTLRDCGITANEPADIRLQPTHANPDISYDV